MLHELSLLMDLTRHNIRRWRMRLLGVALLVALAFTLHVLYSAFVVSAQSNSTTSVKLLELPCDIIVSVSPGEQIYREEEMSSITQRWIFNNADRNMQALVYPVEAVRLNADSPHGSLTLLGLPIGSFYYSPVSMEVEGRWIENSGEIVLPGSMVERAGLNLGDHITLSVRGSHPWQRTLRYGSYRLVGTYDAYDFQPGIILFEDALLLSATSEPNCLLTNLSRSIRSSSATTIPLTTMISWVRLNYPRAVILESNTPRQISERLMGLIYRPGQGLLWMIVVFVFIGVLTIATMTYLERRKEIAALKTVGISNHQMTQLLSIEYACSEILGLSIGILLVTILGSRITWFINLGAGTLFRLGLVATFYTLLALVGAILYPVATAQLATVNQLLFARRIPFKINRLDHLDHPTGVLLYREREENVRLLKLVAPEEAKSEILLILKAVGDPVKKGETIATQERFFGFIIQEWCALCDGTIGSIEESGLVTIKPSDPAESFYPYPTGLLEMEQRSRRLIELAASEVRDFDMRSDRVSARERALEVERRKDRVWRVGSTMQAEEARRLQVVARLPSMTAVSSKPDINQDADESSQPGLNIPHGAVATTIADYAAIARQEERQRNDTRSRRRSNQKWRRFIKPALASAFVLFLYVGALQLATFFGGWADITTVRGTQVVLTTVQTSISAAGNLIPRYTVDVANGGSGRISRVFVSDGEMVQSGQPLLQLENSSVLLALQQARLEHSQAKLAFDTLAIQDAAGLAISNEGFLALLRQEANSSALQQEVENLIVVAPADGVITEIMAEPGDLLGLRAPLFAFYNESRESAIEREIRLLQAASRCDAAAAVLQRLEIRAESMGIIDRIDAAPGDSLANGESVLSLLRDPASLGGDEAVALGRLEQDLQLRTRQEEELRLTAPISGSLSGFKLQVGDQLAAGSIIGQISNTEEIILSLWVGQHQIASLAVGDRAEILNLQRNSRHSGTVREIAASGQTNPQTQVVSFEVKVRVNDTRGLLPGTRVEVRLQTSSGSSGELGPYTTTASAAELREIRSAVAGEVIAVVAVNGASVQAGELLVILENPAISLNQAEAQAKVDNLLRENHRATSAVSVESVYVREGERVSEGQLLAILHSDLLLANYTAAQRDYDDLVRFLVPNDAILSRSSGTLLALHAAVGERVSAGQVLAELSNPNLIYEASRTTNDLLKLEAAYEALLRNPQASALEMARLRLAQAEDNLARREQEADGLLITAPCDGIFTLTRLLREGEELGTRQTFGRISSEEDLTVTIWVDELEIGHLNEGMYVWVTLNAFDEEAFVGLIDRVGIAGEVSNGRVIYPVTVSVSYDARFRSGMTTTVHVILQEAVGVLAIPVDYIYTERRGEEIVELVDRLINRRLIPVPIKTGLRNNRMAEVTSGLREGQIIYKSK